MKVRGIPMSDITDPPVQHCLPHILLLLTVIGAMHYSIRLIWYTKPKIWIILAVYVPKLAQSYVPDPKYFTLKIILETAAVIIFLKCYYHNIITLTLISSLAKNPVVLQFSSLIIAFLSGFQGHLAQLYSICVS